MRLDRHRPDAVSNYRPRAFPSGGPKGGPALWRPCDGYDEEFSLYALGAWRQALLGLGRMVRPTRHITSESEHQRLHVGRQRHQAGHYCRARPPVGVWESSPHHSN